MTTTTPRTTFSTGRVMAFTMMEAMVTIAISSIISLAAAGTMALVLRTTSATRASVSVANTMGQSIQFLNKDIENLGGNELPGQASLVVENDTCGARDDMPACDGNDRITTVVAVADTPVCAVRQGSRTEALSFQYVQGGCCFPSVTPGPGTLVRGVVMLTNQAGGFRPVVIEGVTGATCEFTAVDLMPKDTYLNDPVLTVHNAVSTIDFTPFINGEATMVVMRTYFVDPVSSELRVRNALTGTSALVADHIHDLQVAVGYDQDGDGLVGAAEFAWRESALPAATSLLPRTNTPREVLLSIVQGLPSTLKPDTVTSPLRPPGNGKIITVPGKALRAGLVRLIPYNTILESSP